MLYDPRHRTFRINTVIANSMTAKVLYRLDYAKGIVATLGLGRNNTLYELGLNDRHRRFGRRGVFSGHSSRPVKSFVACARLRFGQRSIVCRSVSSRSFLRMVSHAPPSIGM